MIAHIGALPVEELLPSAAGAGAMLLLARGWVTTCLHRRRGPSR